MKPTRILRALVCLIALAHAALAAGDITALTNIAYKSGDNLSDYERERCKLDLYLPTNTAFSTFVWFHGGGLTGGSNEDISTTGIARSFAQQEDIAVVAPNYRLSPKVNFPAYVEDAAAAVAWTFAHIAEHGGDTNKIFIGGISAGGYLTSILGMNPAHLKKAGVDRDAIAGLIPVSGQMVTHFTIRKERGLATNNVTADEAAPIFYLNASVPPMLVIMGDHDWPGRLEENEYFVAMEKVTGNKRISLLKVADRTHGTIAGKIPESHDPSRDAILKFVRDGILP